MLFHAGRASRAVVVLGGWLRLRAMLEAASPGPWGDVADSCAGIMLCWTSALAQRHPTPARPYSSQPGSAHLTLPSHAAAAVLLHQDSRSTRAQLRSTWPRLKATCVLPSLHMVGCRWGCVGGLRRWVRGAQGCRGPGCKRVQNLCCTHGHYLNVNVQMNAMPGQQPMCVPGLLQRMTNGGSVSCGPCAGAAGDEEQSLAAADPAGKGSWGLWQPC